MIALSDRVSGLTLDTGALLAVERGRPRIRALLRRAMDNAIPIWIPACVVAQAWRDGSKQAVFARLLASRMTTVVPLDGIEARGVGVLCGRSGHSDIVDVSVVLCARERGTPVVTSDLGDLRLIDPDLVLIPV